MLLKLCRRRGTASKPGSDKRVASQPWLKTDNRFCCLYFVRMPVPFLVCP